MIIMIKTKKSKQLTRSNLDFIQLREKKSDDEKRDNYLDEMIKKIQENRKGAY